MKQTEKTYDGGVRYRRSLTVKLFAALLALVVLPMYALLYYVRGRYETYFREELSRNVSESLARSENDIETMFTRLVSIANIICADTGLQNAFSDTGTSYFDRAKLFDQIIAEIEWNNLMELDSAQITLIDSDGNLYSNWSRNFHDYSVIAEQDWVRASIENKGHLVWGLFEDPFIAEDDPDVKYIGLARGVLDNASGDQLGTAIVCVRESALAELLESYRRTPEDGIVVCGADGEILLRSIGSEGAAGQMEQYAVSGKTASGGILHGEDGTDYLVTSYRIEKSGIAGKRELHIYYFTDYSAVNRELGGISDTLGRLVLGCLLAIVALVAVLAWSVVRPIKRLAEQMSGYDPQRIYAPERQARRDEVGRIYAAFYAMDARIKELFVRLEKENRVKEQYKLNFLKAQLTQESMFLTGRCAMTIGN